MTKTRHTLVLSEPQEDVLHLWTTVTLVPGADQFAKVVFTSSDGTTKKTGQRRLLRGHSLSRDSQHLMKSTITNFQKKKLLASSKSTPSRSSCSYNLRPSASCTYIDPDTPDSDGITYCKQCEKEYIGVCSLHFLLVLNKKVPRNGSVRERARLTAPWPLFISDSKVKGAGEGVWTMASLPRGLVFGPYEGHIFKDIPIGAESGYAWHLRSSTCCSMFVDSFKKTTSNWLRYVNCARTPSEINLEAFQYKGNIYYITRCDIKSNMELMIWYGDEYGMELGISCFSNDGISTAAQEDKHHNQQSPAGNQSLTETGRTSKIKTRVSKDPDQMLSVTDTTLSVAKNNHQDDTKKLSKSQSELQHLFITARLRPGENDTAEVVYVKSESIECDSDTADDIDTKENLCKIELASSLSRVKLIPKYEKYSHAYCVECRKTYRGMCPKHKMTLILDTPISRDGSVKDRARLTAPWPLHVAKSKVTVAGEGIWTNTTLPQGLVFGPCEGHIIKNNQKVSGYGWKIHGRSDIEIDAEDTSISNWVRYINCARNYTERNLVAMQIQNEIFYVTNCKINRGTELMVWYGAAYGRLLGISQRDFFKPQLKELDLQRWCPECRILFTSRKYLLQHQSNCKKCTTVIVQGNENKDHPATKKPNRQRYWQVKRKHDTKPMETGIEDKSMDTSLLNENEGFTKCPSQNTRLRSSTYNCVIPKKSSDHDIGPKKSSHHCITPNRSPDYVNSPSKSICDFSASKPSDHSAHHVNLSYSVSLNRSFNSGNSPKMSSDHGKSPIKSSDLCASHNRSSDHSSNSLGNGTSFNTSSDHGSHCSNYSDHGSCASGSSACPNEFSDHDANASSLNDYGAIPSNSSDLNNSHNRPSDHDASTKSPSHHRTNVNGSSHYGGSSNRSSNQGGSSGHGASSSRTLYDAAVPNKISDHVGSSHNSFHNGSPDHVSNLTMSSDHDIDHKKFYDDNANLDRSFSSDNSHNSSFDCGTNPSDGSVHVTRSNRFFDHGASFSSSLDYNTKPSRSSCHEGNPVRFHNLCVSSERFLKHDSIHSNTSDHGAGPKESTDIPNRPFGYDTSSNSSSDHVANYTNHSYHGASFNMSSDRDVTPKRSHGHGACFSMFSDHNASPNRSSDWGVIPNRTPDQGACPSSSCNQGVSPNGSPDQGTCPSDSCNQEVGPNGSCDQMVSPNGSSDQGVSPNGSSDQGVSPKGSSDQRVSPNGSSDQGVSPNGSSDQGVSPSGSSDQGVSPNGSSDQGVRPKGSSDQRVSPKGSSDQRVSPNGSSNQRVSPNGSSDQGVSPNVSSDQMVSPNGSSDQGVSPKGSSDQRFSPNGSSDQMVCPNGSSYQGVSPNQPHDKGFSCNRSSDQGVSSSKYSDQGISPSGVCNQRFNPSGSSYQGDSPSKFYDQEVSPSRSSDQGVNQNSSHNHRVGSNMSYNQGVELNRSSDERVSSSRNSNLGSSPSKCSYQVTSLLDHEYFMRSPDHTIGQNSFLDYDVSPNLSVEFRSGLNRSSDPVTPKKSSDHGARHSRSSDQGVSPNRLSDMGITLKKSLDQGFCPSLSSDQVVSPNGSPHQGFSLKRCGDKGVCLYDQMVISNLCLDHGVTPSKSSNQGISPSKLPDHDYHKRSPDHSIIPSNSLHHDVNPNMSFELSIGLNRFSDYDASHSESSDCDIKPSGLTDFKSNPSRPSDIGISPIKASDYDVSPNRTCDGDISPNKACGVRLGSPPHEISSNSLFNDCVSPSSSPDNVNPKKSPDLFRTLKRSSHHTIGCRRFTDQGATLSKSSDHCSSSNGSFESANPSTSSELCVTGHPDHSINPLIPTIRDSPSKFSSPKIGSGTSSDLGVITCGSVHGRSHEYGVSDHLIVPSNSAEVVKSCRLSDHAHSPIISDHTVSSNRSSRILDDAINPYKSLTHTVSPKRSSLHIVSSNRSSKSICPKGSSDHVNPSRFLDDDVIPKEFSAHAASASRSSDKAASPIKSLDYLTGSFDHASSPDMSSDNSSSPSRSLDHVSSCGKGTGHAGSPSRSSDYVVKPSRSSYLNICVNEYSDGYSNPSKLCNNDSPIETPDHNFINGMSYGQVSSSNSSEQPPDSMFSDQCGSLNMSLCNSGSSTYSSHRSVIPGRSFYNSSSNSFHSAIPSRSTYCDSPNGSSYHSTSPSRSRNWNIHYNTPLKLIRSAYNSSGDETRSIESLNIDRDDDVSNPSPSTEENFSCDNRDSSSIKSSTVSRQLQKFCQPSQNEQVHFIDYGNKLGKKKYETNCNTQGHVANLGYTKKQRLSGSGLHSSYKHSMKENKTHNHNDPEGVNRQLCEYDSGPLRESRIKIGTINELLGKRLQDFKTSSSKTGQSFSSAKRKSACCSICKNLINKSHCQHCSVSDHGAVKEPFRDVSKANAIKHETLGEYSGQILSQLRVSKKNKNKGTSHTRIKKKDSRQVYSSHGSRYKSKSVTPCNFTEFVPCRVAQKKESKIEEEATANLKCHQTNLEYVRAIRNCARTHPHVNPKKENKRHVMSDIYFFKNLYIFKCSKCGKKFLSRYNYNVHEMLLHQHQEMESRDDIPKFD